MKGQPKGLIAAALANMGERFGFYIMMAILTLFISAKFGLDEATAGYIYSGFYASIYLLALVGGIIADKTKNYKATIMWGLIVMSIGYLLIAIPTPTPVPSLWLYLTLTCLGLLVIAFGSMNRWTPLSRPTRWVLLRRGQEPGRVARALISFRPISLVTRLLVWIVRGTPLMLQLIAFFYVPGIAGFQIWPSGDAEN